MTHGLGRIVADGNNSYVTKNDDLYKRIDADINIKTYSIGYLLYKNAPVVQATAPSSFSLLALGLIGFAARRFKKQS